MTARAIVGEKVGMTQVWDEQNRLVPVTVLKICLLYTSPSPRDS